MPNPVSKHAPKPSPTFDDQAVELANQQGVRDPRLGARPDGPSRREVRRRQDATVGTTALTTGFDGLVNMGAELLGNYGAGLVAVPLTAKTLIDGWMASKPAGEAQHKGKDRDDMVLATAMAARGALPRAFNATITARYSKSKGSAKEAIHAFGTPGARTPQQEAFRKRALAEATEGRKAAVAHGVTDAASLARAMKDPAFARRHRESAAFRLGVESVRFEHSPAGKELMAYDRKARKKVAAARKTSDDIQKEIHARNAEEQRRRASAGRH